MSTEVVPIPSFVSLDVWHPETAHVAQAEPDPDLTDAIEDLLLDAGLTFEQTDRLLPTLDAMLDGEANKRAAAVITETLWRALGGSVAGVALLRLILGTGTVSLRDDAGRLGVSHVALLKAQKKCRAQFRLPEGPS